MVPCCQNLNLCQLGFHPSGYCRSAMIPSSPPLIKCDNRKSIMLFPSFKSLCIGFFPASHSQKSDYRRVFLNMSEDMFTGNSCQKNHHSLAIWTSLMQTSRLYRPTKVGLGMGMGWGSNVHVHVHTLLTSHGPRFFKSQERDGRWGWRGSKILCID